MLRSGYVAAGSLNVCFSQTTTRCVLPTLTRPLHWGPHRKWIVILFWIVFFQIVRWFVLYNFGDFTLRREKSLCRVATNPNHYVRSAFQCPRRTATSQKEHTTVRWTLKCGFHIMFWSRSQCDSTKHDITIFAAVCKFELRSPCWKQ